jgi:hypothetical protein
LHKAIDAAHLKRHPKFRTLLVSLGSLAPYGFNAGFSGALSHRIQPRVAGKLRDRLRKILVLSIAAFLLYFARLGRILIAVSVVESYPSGVDRLVLIVDYLDAAQLRPALRARLAAEHGTDDIDGGRRATPSLERGGTGADFGGG